MAKAPKGFNKAYKEAGTLINKTERLGSLLIKGIEKASKNQSEIRSFWNDLQSLFRLIQDYVNGTYTDVSRVTIATATAALIYFVSPIDVIPDFIPILGFIDDAAIVGYVVKRLYKEIDRYQKWQGH